MDSDDIDSDRRKEFTRSPGQVHIDNSGGDWTTVNRKLSFSEVTRAQSTELSHEANVKSAAPQRTAAADIVCDALEKSVKILTKNNTEVNVSRSIAAQEALAFAGGQEPRTSKGNPGRGLDHQAPAFTPENHRNGSSNAGGWGTAATVIRTENTSGVAKSARPIEIVDRNPGGTATGAQGASADRGDRETAGGGSQIVFGGGGTHTDPGSAAIAAEQRRNCGRTAVESNCAFERISDLHGSSGRTLAQVPIQQRRQGASFWGSGSGIITVTSATIAERFADLARGRTRSLFARRGLGISIVIKAVYSKDPSIIRRYLCPLL